MTIDPDSFRGKLYLLIIDKLIIGAIIAVSFAGYDWWKEAERQRRADEAAQIQLEFERARLIKEFLPIIVDDKRPPATRGYVLRSALVTESIDPESGVELARALVPAGFEDYQFRRVLGAAMPGGIPALCRHSVKMAELWREATGEPFRPSFVFNPVSGHEMIPDELAGALHEARLWRSVIIDAIPKLEESEEVLVADDELAAHLYGFFLLLQPGSEFEAQDFSISESRSVRVVGHLGRVLFHSGDAEAVDAIKSELELQNCSPEAALSSIRLARVILSILQEFGPPEGGSIAEVIAGILVSDPPRSEAKAVTAHYWLRMQAADLLEAMNSRMEEIGSRIGWDAVLPQSGARAAEPALIDFLSSFESELVKADSAAELEKLATSRDSEDFIRRAVSILGGIRSEQARDVLKALQSVGSDKLRYFPFLEEEVVRALSQKPEDGA